MHKVFCIMIGILFTVSAFAAPGLSKTDTNKSITKIGTQNGAAYISLSPTLTIGPAGTCLYDIIYIADLGTPAGKAYYATLLTAYAQGKQLSRIDYYNSGAGTLCYMTLLEVS